jgi:hypothetical protein
MAKVVKQPQIFNIKRHIVQLLDAPRAKGEWQYGVEISLAALRSLPDWVLYHIEWEDLGGPRGQPRRCVVDIMARDELEAMMRFKKLWAGLPKKEQ